MAHIIHVGGVNAIICPQVSASNLSREKGFISKFFKLSWKIVSNFGKSFSSYLTGTSSYCNFPIKKLGKRLFGTFRLSENYEIFLETFNFTSKIRKRFSEKIFRLFVHWKFPCCHVPKSYSKYFTQIIYSCAIPVVWEFYRKQRALDILDSQIHFFPNNFYGNDVFNQDILGLDF